MIVTQIVDIPANRRLTIEVPTEVPTGSVVITFTPEEALQKKTRMFCCAKGHFWMADDFDAPIEDFLKYNVIRALFNTGRSEESNE